MLGVVELKPLLVKYRDGHGQEKVRVAISVPGGELYFIDDKMLSKPAQSWVKAGVKAKMEGK